MKKLWTIYDIVKSGKLPYSREGLYQLIRDKKIKARFMTPIVMISDAELVRVQSIVKLLGKWKAFKRYKRVRKIIPI